MYFLLTLIFVALAQQAPAEPDRSKSAEYLPMVRTDKPPATVVFTDKTGQQVDVLVAIDALKRYGLTKTQIEALLAQELSAEQVQEIHVARVKQNLVDLGVPPQAVDSLYGLYREHKDKPGYEANAQALLAKHGLTKPLSKEQLLAFGEQVDLYVTIEVKISVNISVTESRLATVSMHASGVATGLLTAYQAVYLTATTLAESVEQVETEDVIAHLIEFEENAATQK